ncbi:MAG: hypothetical protein K5839_00265 [Treponemataceae bacterium]|nr:hypothetical protein [Treponemataceae bacterium]
MKTKALKLIATLGAVILAASIFTGCSSVFSAGLSGKVVDSESTSSPKEGIQDVEVYVYTKESARDEDYDSWDGSSRFCPTSSKNFVTHTTTDSSGEFTISKVVWEAFFPEFGKTADYAEVFLLFYNEEFGLSKNSQIATVVSDATSNSVYQEMTKIRTTTVLTIAIQDVANKGTISDAVIATIKVPQKSGTKVYTETIAGSTSVSVSYPRYSSGTTVNKPTITISLEQNGNDVIYYQCYNNDETNSYKFFDQVENSKFTTTISGDSCPVTLYMKARKIAVPTFSGTHSGGDGKVITLTVASEDGDVDCGKVTTHSSTEGNVTSPTHGVYDGLGSGYYWIDEDYDGATTTTTATFGEDGSGTYTITSGETSVTKDF